MTGEYRIIQCKNCGGIMHSDQRSHSFTCNYCGSKKPWPESDYEDLPIRYRHKPAERVDGLIKLGHVEVTEYCKKHPYDESLTMREQLQVRDPITAAAWDGAFKVSMSCPACGGVIEGVSTQNIFECKFCGNKMGAEEALKPGAYKKDLVIGVGAQTVPETAIPFKISMEKVQLALKDLCRKAVQIPQDEANLLLEDMKASYIPFSLADLRIKANINTEKGKGTVYQETIDWACPATDFFDERLLDHLDPWNFDEVGAFDPAFCEGDVRIVAISATVDRSILIDILNNERITDDVKREFGVANCEIEEWSSDLRKHKDSTILLPVFYGEIVSEKTGNHITAAVNGQTGAAALILRAPKKERLILTSPGREVPEFSEHTMRTPSVAVRYVKSPFLHEVLSKEDAFKKKKFLGLF